LNEQTANSFAGYRGRGVPVVVGFEHAIVRMDAHGQVTVIVGTHSHGQGHETTLAQIVAAQLSVPLSDVRVTFGDTDIAPSGMGTYSSRTMVMAGGALQLATKELRAKLVRLAAAELEADPADMLIREGRLFPAGVPSRFVTIGEIARMVYLQSDRIPDGESPSLEASHTYRGGPGGGTYANCAQLAFVEVNPDTGKVTLLEHVVVEDCGVVINPIIVEGQVHGGVAQGVGGALFEESSYDEATGQPLSTTLLEYRLPSTTDVPTIRVDHLCTPSPFTPGGVKGAGEAGLTGSPAAIANAVADALAQMGPVLVDELPLTPPRVHAYCQQARRGAVGKGFVAPTALQ
jgi:carbon-monoxide dehydrogenase large subunit